MKNLIKELGDPKGMGLDSFLHSQEAWAQITDSYTNFCTEPSFVNYFWTVRIMHTPIFRLAAMTDKIPPG